MAGPSRYSISKKQAGLEKSGILTNKLKIKNQKDLEDTETLLLADAYSYFLKQLKKDKLHFDLSLIFAIHHYFLKPLYVWAGKIRSVDISKDGMLFCPAIQIEKELRSFETLLISNIPEIGDSRKIISRKIALIHNEFNAIHPFREGNGRTIRLFFDLIAFDNGYKPIDYQSSGIKKYLLACKAGMSRDHVKMRRVIYNGLRKNN